MLSLIHRRINWHYTVSLTEDSDSMKFNMATPMSTPFSKKKCQHANLDVTTAKKRISFVLQSKIAQQIKHNTFSPLVVSQSSNFTRYGNPAAAEQILK